MTEEKLVRMDFRFEFRAGEEVLRKAKALAALAGVPMRDYIGECLQAEVERRWKETVSEEQPQ